MPDELWENAQERKRKRAEYMERLRSFIRDVPALTLITLDDVRSVDASAADLNELCKGKSPLLTKARRGGFGEKAMWRRT